MQAHSASTAGAVFTSRVDVWGRKSILAAHVELKAQPVAAESVATPLCQVRCWALLVSDLEAAFARVGVAPIWLSNLLGTAAACAGHAAAEIQVDHFTHFGSRYKVVTRAESNVQRIQQARTHLARDQCPHFKIVGTQFAPKLSYNWFQPTRGKMSSKTNSRDTHPGREWRPHFKIVGPQFAPKWSDEFAPRCPWPNVLQNQ